MQPFLIFRKRYAFPSSLHGRHVSRLMSQISLSIRIDLPGGHRIGPGKVLLLEEIQKAGSISGAARKIGMSYRRAWVLIQEINNALVSPAVMTKAGGHTGGGAALTASGEKLVSLYRSIETNARTLAEQDFQSDESPHARGGRKTMTQPLPLANVYMKPRIRMKRSRRTLLVTSAVEFPTLWWPRTRAQTVRHNPRDYWQARQLRRRRRQAPSSSLVGKRQRAAYLRPI